MTEYHGTFTHMSQMAFLSNVGRKWDGKTWDREAISLGCLLRIAETSDWLTKMAILSIPLHLAHIVLPYLNRYERTSACWMLAQRFLEEEGIKRGKFYPDSVGAKLVYRIQGQLGEGRRLRLPPVTIFKARTKARTVYRTWLKMEVRS